MYRHSRKTQELIEAGWIDADYCEKSVWHIRCEPGVKIFCAQVVVKGIIWAGIYCHRINTDKALDLHPELKGGAKSFDLSLYLADICIPLSWGF